jgi:hypothetical protein
MVHPGINRDEPDLTLLNNQFTLFAGVASFKGVYIDTLFKLADIPELLSGSTR